MAEAIEELRLESEAVDAEDVRFSYSRPEQFWLNRSIIRLIERLSGQPRLERLYRSWARDPRPGENMFTAALRLMKIGIDTDEEAWARVPRDGPVLFIANHPFGVVDGLLMGHLAIGVRPDTKIMTHSLLCQPPEAREYLFPVDFGGTQAARQTSILTRRRAINWLNSGYAVAVFPGGSVATAQMPLTGRALDAAWHPFVAKLSRIPGLTVVPVFFHGQNSRLFQMMSHVHYALRVALLFRETVRRIGTRVKVSVGEPLAAAELAQFGERGLILRELRRRTLSLAGNDGPDPDIEFHWPKHIDFN